MVGISKRKIGQLVQCTQCGQWKPWQVGVFKSEHGKPRMPCIECDTKRRAENATANRERERKAGTRRMAAWRKANPDKVYQENRKPRSFDRELAKKRGNEWRRSHAENRRVEVQKRKTTKAKLPNMFTKNDWEKCLKYWNNRCCICGRESGNGFVIAIEHWIPLSDPRPNNPGTVPQNILPMCHARNGAVGGCNNLKWNHDPVEWLQSFLGSDIAKKKLAEIQIYFRSVA